MAGVVHQIPPSTAAVRVLVAEPQEALRRAVSALLADEQGLSVTSVASEPEVERVLADQAPDVLLLNRRLMDGDEHVLAVLQELAPHAGILVTGMQHDPAYQRWALKLGARGYLPLDSDPDAFVGAVEAAAVAA